MPTLVDMEGSGAGSFRNRRLYWLNCAVAVRYHDPVMVGRHEVVSEDALRVWARRPRGTVITEA